MEQVAYDALSYIIQPPALEIFNHPMLNCHNAVKVARKCYNVYILDWQANVCIQASMLQHKTEQSSTGHNFVCLFF